MWLAVGNCLSTQPKLLRLTDILLLVLHLLTMKTYAVCLHMYVNLNLCAAEMCIESSVSQEHCGTPQWYIELM